VFSSSDDEGKVISSSLGDTFSYLGYEFPHDYIATYDAAEVIARIEEKFPDGDWDIHPRYSAVHSVATESLKRGEQFIMWA